MIRAGEPAVAEVPSGVAAWVDATAGRAAAAFFGAASRARRQRSLHPDGAAFEALLTVTPPTRFGSGLLDQPREHGCIVRLSRAVGLPERFRDILGLAVRVLDGDGETQQDLLFSTVAGDGTVTRHVLAPARSFTERPLSTILPYRTAHSDVMLLARGSGPPTTMASTLEGAGEAFAGGQLIFELQAALPGQQPVVLGHLSGGLRLPAERGEALRFNPYHAASDLQPTGMLNALRRRAYAASQRHRPRGAR